MRPGPWRERLQRSLLTRPPAPPSGMASAAVLVPVIVHEPDPSILFIRRADHLTSHAGQVAFPGGGREPGDPDLIATALRETREEVGLDPARVEIAGFLDVQTTGNRRWAIVPVVGFVRPGFALKLAQAEVAQSFEAPLGFLMDPDNHQRKSAVWNGQTRSFYALPYKEWTIWGATAGIVRDLYEKTARPPPPKPA